MTALPRLLAVSWPGFAAGPQRGLDDVLSQPVWHSRFHVEVWRPADIYRGLAGKWKLVRDVATVLARGGIDPVVYVNRDAGFAFWLVLVARCLGSRAIAVHAKSALMPWPQKPVLGRIARSTLRRLVALRIAVSDEAGLAMFDSLDGVRALPCAIDFDRLRVEANGSAAVSPRPFRFACIGRLAPEKGFDIALRAFAGIDDPTLPELLVVGEGGEEARLRALADSLGVTARVRFLGPVPEIGQIYAHQCDALLVPSRFEAQGRVVAEAQYFGLPVLVSPAVPASGALEPSALCRVDGWDIDSWSAVMRQLLRERDSRRRPACPPVASPLAADVGAAILAAWCGELVSRAGRTGPAWLWLRRTLAHEDVVP